jgi:hypothetical protein
MNFFRPFNNRLEFIYIHTSSVKIKVIVHFVDIGGFDDHHFKLSFHTTTVFSHSDFSRFLASKATI